jgi:hypothetical protein
MVNLLKYEVDITPCVKIIDSITTLSLRRRLNERLNLQMINFVHYVKSNQEDKCDKVS